MQTNPQEYVQQMNRIIAEVKKAVVGKDVLIAKILLAVLANGNVLMEDMPGVGKTTMALAFSRALSLSYKRMQFTPDVLPSDLTGFSIYQKSTEKFVFQPGALFCQLFLADEINRTSSKTQSALLEAMEEHSVTIDGRTYQLPQPHLVIATQNPIGSVGTQMLPESQMDRFMFRLEMGYPNLEDEMQILRTRHDGNPLETVQPVVDSNTLLHLQQGKNAILYYWIDSLKKEIKYSNAIENNSNARYLAFDDDVFFETLNISHTRIKKLHQYITNSNVDSDYRKCDVRVSSIYEDGTEDVFWHGAKSEDVKKFMDDFIQVYKQDTLSSIFSSPFLKSALIHLLFVRIHPFNDGMVELLE